jgi:glycosyltransferase involved in cell wall biosynthesis
MKIIHVSDSYLPTIGGLERSIESISKVQISEGHEVVVVSSNHPDEPEEKIVDGIKVYRRQMFIQKLNVMEDPRRPFHPPINDPMFVKHLIAIFEKEKPDIIHSHAWSTISVINAAQKLGIPVVSTAHDYGHICAVKQGTFKDGTVCSGPELNKCIAHAKEHYGAIKGIPIALGIKATNKKLKEIQWTAISTSVAEFGNDSIYHIPDMTVIPSYVPETVFNYSKAAKPDFAPEKEYICFVGALSPMKGLHILLQAQANLWTRGIEIPLLVIGVQRPDTPDLSQDGVTVAYSQPHDKVMASWKNAEIGIIPSVIPEAFGQVAVECLATGTPVIVAGHGGLKDIVEEGVQGLQVTPNDVASLEDALEKLWTDIKLRNKMGKAGIERAKLFTARAVYPQVLKAYEDTIEKERNKK